jgi:hypothetical protein
MVYHTLDPLLPITTGLTSDFQLHFVSETGRQAERPSVMAPILAALCSASCDRLATHVARIATHVVTSSALQGAVKMVNIEAVAA